MTRQHSYVFMILVLVLLVTGPMTVARAGQWLVPVTVSNAGSVSRELDLGIDPDGTYGLDAQLGEVGLPPWPPTAVFDARFLIDGLEGLYLDIRDDSTTERTHKIQIQEGDGGYPITLRWDASALPAATFTMQDGYTGALIPAFDMAQTDSLVIPVGQSYIKRIDIVVIPGELPPGPPVITPAIPDLSIFLGQRFGELTLDDYVVDPDNADAELTWVLTGEGPPWVTLGDDRVLEVDAPAGWTGTGSFNLRVSDPGGLQDDQDFLLTVLEPGLPSWSVNLQVANGEAETQDVTLGIDTGATDGIDPTLGEIALPPWPPSSVFDVRLTLPDGGTQALLDLRPSGPGVLTFDLEWQSGSGGYPMVVTWPSELPLGSFTIRDNLGGTFIPAMDMSTVQSLTVPDSLSFVTGLIIEVDPVIDTQPPVGPDGLVVVSWTPWSSVTLNWSPCSEEHFAYYEILFDTNLFTSDAQYAWDWSEDTALMDKTTVSTTIALPGPADRYVFRIRAWDTFGNAGPLSPWCMVGDVSGVESRPPDLDSWELLGNSPNPFNPRTRIQFTLKHRCLVSATIYDATGRIVRRFVPRWFDPGNQAFCWDGRNDRGQAAASGFYLYKVQGAGVVRTGKMTMIR